MKKIGKQSIITILVSASLTWSCEGYMDQFKMDKLSTEVEVSPSIAAPVVYGSFSLQDVLEAIDTTSFVSQTEDSLLYIYYLDTAYSVNAGELVDIPDQVTSETYIESDIAIPDWLALGEGETYVFTKTESLNFEIEEGDQIDSVILKAGNLNMSIFSEFRHSGELTITSSSIFDDNGDSLDMSFTISEVDGSYSSDEDYDLTDYRLYFEERNDSAFLDIHFSLLLTKSAAGIDLDDECGIIMTFEELDFSHIFGFIAEREVINATETMEVQFYDAVSSILDVLFKEPEFNLYVYNSYGIPVSLDLNNVLARSSTDGSDYPLTFEPGVFPFLVEAPTVNQLGETVVSELEISYNSSNIVDVIAEAPDRLTFTVQAETGSIPGGEQNFVLDTSKMIVEAELVLPMYLRTEGYTIEDTLDLDLEGMFGDFSFIQDANLRLTTLNEWPLEMEIQIYFMDETYTVLDSIFKESKPFLEAAPVDAEGELATEVLTPNVINVDYTGEEFSNLDGTKYMWFKANASTTDNGATYVKFYSHYLLNYDISIEADFLINPSELNFDSDDE